MNENTKRGHVEDRRSREVFRYFKPDNPAALNSTWLPFGDDSTSAANLAAATATATSKASTSVKITDPSRNRHSPNTTLTSFAQLAALSLKSERALITIIDRETQHILAEATRTLNIGDTSELSDDGEGLWLGTSTVENPWSVCQETIALQPSKHLGEYRSFVITNLVEDERFRRLPFVQDEPHFRFYAGTPLTTENGVNIGCLFVLDPSPRAGLSQVEKKSLANLSSLVMDFLRVSRQASEGRRASRLARGLTYFVDGSSSFLPNSPCPTQTSLHKYPDPRVSPPGSRSGSRSSRSNKSSVRRISKQSNNGDARSSGILSNGKFSINPPSDHSTILSEAYTESNYSLISEQSQSQGIQWTFQRAANLLRESLELGGEGGVSFLGVGSNSLVGEGDGAFYSAENNSPAPLLALSTQDEPFASRECFKTSHTAAEVDRVFLQQLVQRYPKGRLWSFHQDGSLTTSDEEGKSGQSGSENSDGGLGSRRKRIRASEASMLNAFFPKANQVMFIPLWDGATSQWHSCCFCWSTQETNVLSSAVDLSAILGFASSIMAECSRIDSNDANRRKGDFIGKISHELRSPLHGILAAAEFLQGTDPSTFQNSLIETINTCGRTLLETMNQLLDFSKVMSSGRKRRQVRRNAEDSSMQDTDSSLRLDPLVVTDVLQLLEEVVESVYQGHSFGKRSSANIDQSMGLSMDFGQHGQADQTLPDSDENVQIIIDTSDNDWLHECQAGSLRRIIMNVVGNALKYTTEGHIRVRLEIEKRCFDITDRQNIQDAVKLSISDTGKGMSHKFLRQNLFKPFSQEDPLAAGTGLGLSIVHSLVRRMNGRIRVESRAGEGTTVTVLLPLERSVEMKENSITQPLTIFPSNAAWCDLLRQSCLNKRFTIWGPKVNENHLFWAPIRQYMTEWFSLEIVPYALDQHIDLVLADEEIVGTNDQLPAGLHSLLVFCKSPSEFQKKRMTLSTLADNVVFVWLPCGPKKLARAILEVLGPRKWSSNDLHSPHVRQTITESPGSQSNGVSPSLPTHVKIHSTISEGTENETSINTTSVPISEKVISATGASQERTHKPRILVVEDNEINLKLILAFLRKREFQVLDAATNGRIAVEQVEQNSHGYDFIFMDMSMPVMDGFEATRTIRSFEKENHRVKAALIVALTGLSSFPDESNARAAGVDIFLSKPVSFREVARLLDDWEGNQNRQNS